MRALERLALGVLAVVVAVTARPSAGQAVDRRPRQQVEQALEQEGEALVALADAAARTRVVPSDFPLDWHNDFLKAQTGTFIPFIVAIGRSPLKAPAVLMYVRAARRAADDAVEPRSARRRVTASTGSVRHPFEEIYPVDLAAHDGPTARVARGFSLPAGDYDLTVVVRERGADDRRGRPLTAVLRRPLSVPDFSGPELMMSTVIVADRFTTVTDPAPARDLPDQPYVIAGRDIRPAEDRLFRRAEELVVVFLVYNPAVTRDELFDLEVEYHFFRKSGAGDVYVNRTEPQRFNPTTLGPHYNPSAGHPVMAGQGVALAGFDEGDYTLRIKVTDLVSGHTLVRNVTFTVRA